MLLLRANTLALGTAAAGHCSSIGSSRSSSAAIHPVVPAQGSVGASGDLAPLAHLACR
jgi:histidine ammonia-lyase